MDAITLHSTVVRSTDVMASAVDNELVMMDIERGMYYALDAVGTDIWGRIAQPVRVADLCDTLRKVYSVDAATCQKDVLDLLNDMAQNGLLTTI